VAHLEDPGTRGAAECRRSALTVPPPSTRMLRLLPALFWLGTCLAWEFGSRNGWISRLFFPAPSTILVALAQSAASGALLLDLGYTLGRLILGLALGGVSGLALGLAMGWSRTVRLLAGPVVAAVHPMPKLALLPLALVIFGIGEQSKIVMIALTSFFPMLINSLAGVEQIDALTLEVARHYGARGFTLFRRIIWPASLPMVLIGVRLALNGALLMTVAVELVLARQGLGASIWLAWQTLRTEQLYVALLVIALLGLGSNAAIERITAHLTPWRGCDDAA
jgi:ABC-type nitrate/sulfonate/bicarbonate transport system permease component